MGCPQASAVEVSELKREDMRKSPEPGIVAWSGGAGDSDCHFEKGVMLGQELRSGLAWERRNEAPADPSPGAPRP